jgi:hypothetical protein
MGEIAERTYPLKIGETGPSDPRVSMMRWRCWRM